MNDRQLLAYNKPCFTDEDRAATVFEEIETVGRLTVRTNLQILAFFGDKVWKSTAFVSDGGQALRIADLTKEERLAVNQIMSLMLEGVGTGEAIIMGGEEFIDSEFEAARIVSPAEAKKLAGPDVEKLFDIRRRQQLALQNPFPNAEDMIRYRFSKVVDVGGGIFSSILTIKRSQGKTAWHASTAMLDRNKRPINLIGSPSGQAEFAVHLTTRLLAGVGTGRAVTERPNKETAVFSLFKDLSPAEDRSLPKNQKDAAYFVEMAMKN